jgi:hypothetical protein
MTLAPSSNFAPEAIAVAPASNLAPPGAAAQRNP